MRRRVMLTLGVIFLAIVLWIALSVALFWYSGQKMARQYTNLTIRDVSRLSGIAFPSDARIIRQKAIVGLTAKFFWIKVEMGTKDVPEFVDSLPLSLPRGDKVEKGETSRTHKLNTTSKGYLDPEWWNLEKIRKYIAVSLPGSRGDILIDLNHGQNAFVYLRW